MSDKALILFMIAGGTAIVATVFLPGQSRGWRVFSGLLGAAIVLWMGWVFLFGGTYSFNALIVLLPFIFATQRLRSVLNHRRETTAPPPCADPHGNPTYATPEQEPHAQPGSYTPHAPDQPTRISTDLPGPPPGQHTEKMATPHPFHESESPDSGPAPGSGPEGQPPRE